VLSTEIPGNNAYKCKYPCKILFKKDEILRMGEKNEEYERL